MNLEQINTNTILKELPTEGHSPLLLVGSDYKMYVAKNDKGKLPPISLINECFASFCFNNWGVLTPKIKIIELAKELIRTQENLSNNHKPYYYDTLCFGSEFVNNAIDVNAFLISDSKKAYNKLNNPLDLFHITLFDTWVENDDRKPTNYNLVLQPIKDKFNIIPIDNAFIFSTMNYRYLNFDFVSASANDHLLVSDLGYLVKNNFRVTNKFINNEREYFYLCIEKCRLNFDSFMNRLSAFYTLDKDSSRNLKDFLFDAKRNNKVFEEYVFRLNQ